MTSENSSSNDVIDGRYRLVRQLGRGAQGTTHLAIRETTGDEVALKELDFGGIGSWDELGVFEREAAVLGGLTHPNIPRIIESFRVDDDERLRLFLAQEFVDGEDLRQRLEDGEEFDEQRLRRIAANVLDILAYLHGYSPPVLHRDVKPANLIERPDGSIALVDFGAAQGSAQGEAVIGTTGYMPAEQLMGRPVPASDMYALGATLIHLATGRHPADLGHGLGLVWREHATLSQNFSEFIERLVAPMPEDRFPTALAAKRSLEQAKRRVARELAADMERSMLDELEAMHPTRSPDGRFHVLDTGGKLAVQGPLEGHGAPMLMLLAILAVVGGVVLAWLTRPALIMAPILVMTPIFLFLHLHEKRGVSRIHVTKRGVELVRRRDEVLRLVPLKDIAGPDIVAGTAGRALVLWKSDGRSILLDHGSNKDLKFVHDALQRGLARARRMAE